MEIKIGSKFFESNTLEMIDSISHLPTKDWIYFTETLYLAPSGEFILKTEILLNALRYGPMNENGDVLPGADLKPQIEYQILSEAEAEAWQEASVWEV